MSARIESEEKKKAFIQACENINPTKESPERLLQAQDLENELKKDETDISRLYKQGCPCSWIESAYKGCDKKKPKPSFSNECTNCWLYNLTEETDLRNPEEINVNEALSLYERYSQLGLSPEELYDILDCLGWFDIRDPVLFSDVIKDIAEYISR